MNPSSHLYYIYIHSIQTSWLQKFRPSSLAGLQSFQISAVMTAELRSMLEMLIECLCGHKETPKQPCLQSTSTSTFKWKDPQIQSYIINTPFSFLACTFLLFLTLLHEHWVTISHVFYTDSLKLQSDLRSHISLQKSKWLAVPLAVNSGSTYLPFFFGSEKPTTHGTWAHGSMGGNDLIRPGLSWGKHGWKISIFWR